MADAGGGDPEGVHVGREVLGHGQHVVVGEGLATLGRLRVEPVLAAVGTGAPCDDK